MKKLCYNSTNANIVQWQNPSFPSSSCGFDSRYSLQNRLRAVFCFETTIRKIKKHSYQRECLKTKQSRETARHSRTPTVRGVKHSRLCKKYYITKFGFVKRKKQSHTLLMSLRVQFPAGQQAYDSAMDSIAYKLGFVKRKRIELPRRSKMLLKLRVRGFERIL